MMIRNRISLFVTTYLIIGFFFLALPEKGYSQIPTGLGCCLNREDSNPEIFECAGCEGDCAIRFDDCPANFFRENMICEPIEDGEDGVFGRCASVKPPKTGPPFKL